MLIPPLAPRGGLAAQIPLALATAATAQTLPRADQRIRTHLLTLFSVPRAALPTPSPARKRLVALILLGYDIRLYPRLGAFDLDDPANWCAWLHDQRVLLSDYLAHWQEIPIPAFPHGVPLLAGLAADRTDGDNADAADGAEGDGLDALEVAL